MQNTDAADDGICIYYNIRAWRSQLLLWLFVALTIVAFGAGCYSWATGDSDNLLLSLILGVIVLLCAIGMEFYCRRYVQAIEVVDGDFIVETRGLIKTYLTRGIGEVGRHIDGKMLPDNHAARLAMLTDSLRPLQMAGVDNQFHFLKVGPQNRKYILDVTADPLAGQRVKDALAELRKQRK